MLETTFVVKHVGACDTVAYGLSSASQQSKGRRDRRRAATSVGTGSHEIFIEDGACFSQYVQ